MPTFNANLETIYWLGRSVNSETLGKAYDAWESAPWPKSHDAKNNEVLTLEMLLGSVLQAQALPHEAQSEVGWQAASWLRVRSSERSHEHDDLRSGLREAWPRAG